MSHRRLAVLVLLALAAPAAASAQHPQTRTGFWLNAGLGIGSYGCQDCDGRESGGSGTLSLGGTLSQHVNLGVGVNVWVKQVNGVDVSASTVTAMLRYYPSATGGFFLTGGVGAGELRAEVNGVSYSAAVSQKGVGILLGLGLDVRLSRNLSLTPFWHLNGFGIDDGNANFGQLGLSLTVH